MSQHPRISLEQWRALLAVVDAGGYAQAAALLHKSQSSVTYAVQKLESLLGVKAFEVVGPQGTPDARTAKCCTGAPSSLLEEASALEGAAGSLAAGWESELRIAAEIIFPTWLLLQCCAQFGEEQPQTRIELYETVLGGTDEALQQRRVDLAICSQIPAGFTGDPLMRLRFIPVAHPEHALHQLGRELTLQDLRRHRHIIIRDSGSQRRSGSWLGAEQSWTVSQKATAIHAVSTGSGFAWYADDTIRGELERGELKQLPMREGKERWAELYLVYADRDYAGPGTLRLAQLLRDAVARQCRAVKELRPERAAPTDTRT